MAHRSSRLQQAHDARHREALALWKDGSRAIAVLEGRFPVTLTPAQQSAIGFARNAAHHSDPAWIFHNAFPADLRGAFDSALVALQWPGAWLAGVVEQRFVEFARELRAAR